MKVLHLITSLNRGGAENHLLCLVRGQLKENKKFCDLFERGWILEKLFLSLGIEVIKLNEINILSQIYTIRKIIKNNKINIVHSHLPHMELLGYLSVIGNKIVNLLFLNMLIMIILVDHKQKNSKISSIISLIIYSKASRIIAISKSVKNFLIKSTFNRFKNKFQLFIMV